MQEYPAQDVGPCECGHPTGPSVAELVRYHAVTGAERRPMPIGCTIAMVVVLALVVLAVVGLVVCLR